MKIDLDALEALEKAATVGDWFGEDGEVYARAPAGGNYTSQITVVSGSDGETGMNWARAEDIALIAAARNVLPALLAEVRAAREWLKQEDRGGLWSPEQAKDAYRALVAANSGGEG